jgi:hypothetical protein
MHKMRRLTSILALAAACGLTNAPADRAEAIVLTGLHGIGAAIDDSHVVEQAHCRPGRRHHRVRPYDGCYKVQRRGPAIVQPSPPMRGNPGFQHDGGFGSLFER